MFNVNIPWEATGPYQSFLFGVALLYGLIWLVTLGFALTRIDLDPVSRLMWVMVVIFVPFFGVLLYFLLAPPRENEDLPHLGDTDSDITGTPWERDSGHRSRE